MTRLSFFLLLGLVFPLVFASPPNYEHNREHNLLGRNDVLFTRSKLAGAKVVVDDRAKRLLRRTNSDEGGSQAKGGQPAKRKTAREKKPQQSQEQRQIQEEPLLQRIRQKAQELEYLRKLALVEYLQEAGREVTPEGWKLLDGMGRSEVERTLEREVFSRQVVEGMAKKKALAWDCDVNFMCLPEIIVLPRAQIERWAVCTDAARSVWSFLFFSRQFMHFRTEGKILIKSRMVTWFSFRTLSSSLTKYTKSVFRTLQERSSA